MRRGLLLCAAFAAACSLGGAGAAVAPARGSTEVVVTVHGDQDAVARSITQAIPGARIRWHYRHVLNGLSVVLAQGSVARLARVKGVDEVYDSVRYTPALDQSVPLINAPALWGPTLATAGQGLKIGIIDDGVDQAHRFFSPSGFTAPTGFPRGNRAYTTAKVIVARAFPPPGAKWKYASRPFDPVYSEHATHVAGIAAGDYNTTQRGGRPVSGVAPRAYLGNYKVLTVPTPGVGLDGNSPEIVKGIDAAVGDGMNVINLSLGEPEVAVDRDIVVKAIDAAAANGVVPVISAGNDFDDFGAGSIDSPGNAPKAITAAAVSKSDEIASFSSGGPSGIDLGFKPDVSAPGVDIYSSVPTGWASFSGTSMAAPHVSGGAALLLQRHPAWTPAEVKSALVLTGRPVWADGSHSQEVPATREGGGLIDLAAANDPLLFASPTDVSFGLVGPNQSVTRSIDLTDAGGGTGPWIVSAPGSVAAPPTVSVPGRLVLTARGGSRAGDVSGFVVLSRGTTTRRIPFWFRSSNPRLRFDPHTLLSRPGIHHGNTRGGASRVSCYRYPADPSALNVPACLRGPEQVFRVRIGRPVANFGVVLLSHGRGVRVQPRVVRAGNEDRLTGYAGLPLNLNPYLPRLEQTSPAAGAVRPDPGSYDVVFDTSSRASAGPFTFRFWIGDTTPPQIRLATRRVAEGAAIVLRVTDRGSGVDPGSLHAKLDGTDVSVRYRAGRARIDTSLLAPGRHSLLLRASDYQEAKNMENTGPILPNTRTLRTTFVVR